MSAEVVGPVDHRPGKLEGPTALQVSLDHIGSGEFTPSGGEDGGKEEEG